MSCGTSNSYAAKWPERSLSMSVSVAGEGHQLPQSCHEAGALVASLTTAGLTGIPFIVLGYQRHVAQDFHSARLIQPAPTLPNDSRGLACGLGDGMACNPKQHGDGGFSSGH